MSRTPCLSATIGRGSLLTAAVLAAAALCAQTDVAVFSLTAVSASSSNGSYPPKNAFDGNTSTQFSSWLAYRSAAPDIYIQYDFPTNHRYAVSHYRLAPTSATQSPKTLWLQGSNDGAAWTTLDSQTDRTNGWTAAVLRPFNAANTVGYGSFRFFFPTNNGDATYIGLTEIDLICSNNQVTVSGSPAAYGFVSPPYGQSVNGLALDETVAFAAPAIGYGPDAGWRGILQGYTVSTNGTAVMATGTAASFEIDYPGTPLTVVWEWDPEVLVTFSASDPAAGSVSQEGGWQEIGATVSATATAAAGCRFVCWSGEVPDDQVFESTVTVTADQPRALTAIFAPLAATGVTRSYIGATGGRWHDPANWTNGLGEAGVPAAGDQAVIAKNSTTVLLDAPTAPLAGLSLSGTSTLLFTNWFTALCVGSVTVGNQAVVTCAGPFLSHPVMSNRVWIICGDLTVAAGGRVNVDGRGYQGGYVYQNGYGPGFGYYDRDGAGHGGRGGKGNGAQTYSHAYGSASAPLHPGSGGGASHANGSAGGGAVRVAASGLVRIDGTVSAAGITGQGSGSGGSIYITCGAFDGTNTLNASGGAAGSSTYGGGGGGRIAVIYTNAAAQAALSPTPIFQLAARYNKAIVPTVYFGEMGTLYLSDASFFPTPDLRGGGQVTIPGFTHWEVPHLNAAAGDEVRLGPGLAITVTNDVLVSGGGDLHFTNVTLNVGGDIAVRDAYSRLATRGHTAVVCGGDLTITTNACMEVISGPTNETWVGYGSRLAVGGALTIVGPGSVFYPGSHPTNGGSLYMEMRDLILADTSAQINANARGFGALTKASPSYITGYGPGTASYRHGASYGGWGEKRTTGGVSYGPYGCSNAPAAPGSDAGRHWGNYVGGYGGGLVWAKVDRAAVVNGIVSANGGNGTGSEGAGGSGGGIYVVCRRLEGTGLFRANGGNSTSSGSGGGGRIAIWSQRRDGFGGTAVATNGVSTATVTPVTPGGPGTVVWGLIPASGTLLLLR